MMMESNLSAKDDLGAALDLRKTPSPDRLAVDETVRGSQSGTSSITSEGSLAESDGSTTAKVKPISGPIYLTFDNLNHFTSLPNLPAMLPPGNAFSGLNPFSLVTTAVNSRIPSMTPTPPVYSEAELSTLSVAAPWNMYVNQLNNRKRKASTTPPSVCSSHGEEDKNNDNSSIADERKDYSYWDRRRKNNEAAKRSRDARRRKEEEIALRAAYLERENLKLRAQVTILKNETTNLHYMLYNRGNNGAIAK